MATANTPRFQYKTEQFGPPLREFLEFMIETKPQEIEVARRGAMTTTQLREIAAKWGMTVDEYRRLRQGIILPAEGEISLANMINQAYRLAENFTATAREAAREGRLEDARALETQAMQQLHNAGMLVTRYFAAGSETGRALRIRQEGLITSDKLTEKAMRAIMDETRLSEMQQAVLLKKVFDAQGDRRRVLDAIKEAYLPTWWDRIMEYRTAVLLTNPVTLLRNVVGNTAALVTREFEVFAGVPIDMLYGVLPRGMKLGSEPSAGKRHPLEIGADLTGLMLGIKEGSKLALQAFRDEDFAITRGRVGDEAVQIRSAIRGPTGKVVRYPFRILSAQDLFFSTTIKYAEAYRLAMRHAINQGLVGNERMREVQRMANEALAVEHSRVRELLERPDLVEGRAEQIARRAEAQGLEFTFREHMSPFLKDVDRLRFQKGPGAKVFRFVMPFYATPVNVAKFGLRRSPLTSWLSGRNVSDLRANRELAVDAAARMVTGAAAFVPIFMLATEGYITGQGPSDRQAREQLERRPGGWQQYSIKIGDRWYSYKGFSPMTEILAMAGELSERFHRGDPFEDPMRHLLFLARTIVDQPFMKGVSDLLRAVTEDDRYGPFRVSNVSVGAIQSFIPRGVAFLARVLDPTAREFRVDFMQKLSQQIPGYRNQTLPMRDVLGRTYVTQHALMDQVIRSKGDTGSPVDHWLFEVKETVDDPVIRYPTRRFLGQTIPPESYDLLLQARQERLIPELEKLSRKRTLRKAPADLQRQIIRQTVSRIDGEARDTLATAFELERLGLPVTAEGKKAVLKVVKNPVLRSFYELDTTTDEQRVEVLRTGKRP